MHKLEIYGNAEVEICEGCEGHCGEDECKPGAKKTTKALVAEFMELLALKAYPVDVQFYEATDENLERQAEVKRLLSMADLAPAFVLDDKLLFFGGFSPAGLVQELEKRLNLV
ncbi:hypothetical protein MASR2M78_34500 [Treponema sp.]